MSSQAVMFPSPVQRGRPSLCFDRAGPLPGRRLATRVSPAAAQTRLSLASAKLHLSLSDLRGSPRSFFSSFFSFFSESVGNHKQIVQRLFFPNLMNDLDGIFLKLLITTCAHSQLPLTFLFFRANIDEVETEVVEIEAKLDKVRHLMLPLHMHFICRPIWSCFQRQEMNITLLFSLH